MGSPPVQETSVYLTVLELELYKVKLPGSFRYPFFDSLSAVRRKRKVAHLNYTCRFPKKRGFCIPSYNSCLSAKLVYLLFPTMI